MCPGALIQYCSHDMICFNQEFGNCCNIQVGLYTFPCIGHVHFPNGPGVFASPSIDIKETYNNTCQILTCKIALDIHQTLL